MGEERHVSPPPQLHGHFKTPGGYSHWQQSQFVLFHTPIILSQICSSPYRKLDYESFFCKYISWFLSFKTEVDLYSFCLCFIKLFLILSYTAYNFNFLILWRCPVRYPNIIKTRYIYFRNNTAEDIDIIEKFWKLFLSLFLIKSVMSFKLKNAALLFMYLYFVFIVFRCFHWEKLIEWFLHYAVYYDKDRTHCSNGLAQVKLQFD